MNRSLEVLDHGFIDVVDYMGSDSSVVRSARVSYNNDNSSENKSDEKLINYLMKNEHSTPFESCTVSFHIKAPIFVIRQWSQYMMFSYDEVPAGYTELENEFYLPKKGLVGIQSKSNRQQRDLDENPNSDEILGLLKYHSENAFLVYKELLLMGCPKELARSILPVNTYIRMYCTGNLWNYLKFIRLRDHDHAQYEIRQYAKVMKELLTRIYPITMKAFSSKY